MTPRRPDQREYVHERLGDDFERSLSTYDTQRRVETLIDEFLVGRMRPGATALDVGCGLGFFSERLAHIGANVTACDLGPKLVEATRQRVGCEGIVADALQLTDAFGTDGFDVVVSSECIEHTPDPRAAVRQMARVLKPGGYLSLSTPNIVWYPVVKLATVLRARPFDGFENFSTFGSLTQVLESEGVELVEARGLHLYPFQLRMHGLSRWCDRNLQPLKPLMINICLLGQKKSD